MWFRIFAAVRASRAATADFSAPCSCSSCACASPGKGAPEICAPGEAVPGVRAWIVWPARGKDSSRAAASASGVLLLKGLRK